MKSLDEKIASVKKNRGRNYKESCRLEGIVAEHSHETSGMTKEEVIEYYREKVYEEDL